MEFRELWALGERQETDDGTTYSWRWQKGPTVMDGDMTLVVCLDSAGQHVREVRVADWWN